MSPRIRKSPLGKGILLGGILVLTVFFTVFSKTTSDAAAEGLRLCAVSVVPSLFPFMVLSAMAAKAAAALAGSGSGGAVMIPVVLGTLCGFPVGAATVAGMYRSGVMEKRYAEHLCALCNNAGPAFVIAVIGREFWGSAELGLMFYVCQILSAAVIFGVWRLFLGNRRFGLNSADAEIKSATPALSPNSANAVDVICRGFCTSVAESAVSVVQICGYIVFFRVVCHGVSMVAASFTESALPFAAVASVLEFTTGSSAAAAVGGWAGAGLCGFAIGFSGLSVMAQSTGLLSKVGLSAAPLFRLKLVIGVLCGGLCAVSYETFDFTGTAFSEAVGSFSASPIPAVVVIALALVAFTVTSIPANRQSRRR